MKSILLIEDDPFLIDLYATRLRSAGFEVEVATSGKEGLEKLREKKTDLLLLDIVLPTVDGWEVLKELRKDRTLDDMKIFIFSNLDQKTDIQRAQEFKVTKYLIKAHFTPSEVIEEIKKIFE